jgi:hypothetical protein
MKPLIKIDELLKYYGMDRELLIKKNPDYEKVFAKLDKYYEQYQASPTESMLTATNSVTLSSMEFFKKENPDMFEVSGNEIEEQEIIVDDTFSKYKTDIMFYLKEGDQDAMDDIFNEVGEKKSKHLLSFENFKLFNSALKSKNNLIVIHLKELGEKYNIYPDMVLGRDGENLNLIIATKDTDLIKESLIAVKDKEETKDIISKNIIDQQIMEMGNDELVTIVDDILDKDVVEDVEAGTKKQKKSSTILKEQTPLKQIFDMISSGKLQMDTPLVVKLERKFAIKIIDTPEEIAVGKSNTYKFIVPTEVSKYFDAKILLADENYTLYEAEKTMFEIQFGLSVYELGICWFNLINMVSVEDIVALFYLANISTTLMVDRNNQQLRNDYLGNLKIILQQPESNKVSGRFFQVKESNLMSLRKSGFLDDQLCPTKLLYAAVVLHSFPFPAFTHPFEFVKIDNLSSMFQFETIKGEFGNETFYTDGDVLFHNYTDTSITKFVQAFSDTSRTVILNLKSNSRSDIKKTATTLNHFIPVIYTVPKSGISIPTFTIRILDMENRKINWGVYELSNGTDNVYINSYALSNGLFGMKSENFNIMQYSGVLSDSMFASPTQGVVMQNNNTFLVVRGLNGESFLSENFGKNWKQYYADMYGKKHLATQVLDKIDADMVKAIYTTNNTLVVSTETGLQYKVDKKYENPYQKDVAKPTPQITKVVVPISKKDDRVYISKVLSQEKLDKSLWPVFDAVQNLKGEVRDEAILDEMYARGVTRVFPNQLIYLGFGLKEYVVDKPERINFKNKYRLTIPILLSYQPTYYLDKI